MSTYTIAFRVDVSISIEMGHFLRCLILADALKPHGAKTRAVRRHLPARLRGMLAAKGNELALLDGTKNDAYLDELVHAHRLGVGRAQDAVDSIQVLSDRAGDWLIVDRYALDSRWESLPRRTASGLLRVVDSKKYPEFSNYREK